MKKTNGKVFDTDNQLSLFSVICNLQFQMSKAEMRMVKWMCGIKVKDRFPGSKLRERLEIDDIISVLQHNRLQWYGHVL